MTKEELYYSIIKDLSVASFQRLEKIYFDPDSYIENRNHTSRENHAKGICQYAYDIVLQAEVKATEFEKIDSEVMKRTNFNPYENSDFTV